MRWALDADLDADRPRRFGTREPERPRRRDRLAGPDDRPRPRRGRARRGGARRQRPRPSWASTSATRCVSVVRAVDAVLRVVGEVVAWGTDEVDDGFEVSMDGLRALAASSCDGRFGCDPTVQYVVARSDGGRRPRRAGGGRVRRRFRCRRRSATSTRPGRCHGCSPRSSPPSPSPGCCTPFVTVLRVRRRDIVIGRALGLTGGAARSAARWTASTMTAARRPDRSPARDRRRAARVGQDGRPARRRARARPPVVGAGPHRARRARHHACPRRGPRPPRRPRPADPPRRMMPRPRSECCRVIRLTRTGWRTSYSDGQGVAATTGTDGGSNLARDGMPRVH